VAERKKADFLDIHAHFEDERKANQEARDEAMRTIREIDVSDERGLRPP
jgi:hypothetical protein